MHLFFLSLLQSLGKWFFDFSYDCVFDYPSQKSCAVACVRGNFCIKSASLDMSDKYQKPCLGGLGSQAGKQPGNKQTLKDTFIRWRKSEDLFERKGKPGFFRIRL